MNATLKAAGPLAWFLECAPILRAVRLHQTRHLGKWGNVFLILGLIGAAVGVSVGVIMLSRTELGWGGALPLMLGGVLAAFCGGTLLNVLGIGALQNTPANAVLVPRLNRLVRRTVILAWLATMAGFALFSTAIPHGVLIPLGAHLFMLSLMSLRGYAGLAWLLLFPVQALPGRAALFAFVEAPPVLALCYAGALLLGWRVLTKAYPVGGDGHFALSKDARTSHAALRSMGEWARYERTREDRRRIYARVLAHDIKMRRPQHLLIHVFGPTCHRFELPSFLLMYGALALVLWLAVRWWWPQYSFQATAMVTVAAVPGLTALPILSAYRFVIGMKGTAGEQALFRLAPAAPRPAALNRLLAPALLRTCLFDWAGSLLLMLAIGVLWDATAAWLLGYVTIMCAVLMFAGWPLRDHARSSPIRHARLFGLVALAVLAGTVIFMTVGQYWLWAACLALSLLFIGRRYRAMVGAPPAFPAGRLDAQ